MRKNLKEMAEKSLKSFLKKKKVGYTAALLVAYLISGGIGLASSEQLFMQAQATQESLLANIEAQKAEIQALLKENEQRLKELQGNQLTLLRQGDYYSKPIYSSNQVFFNYGYENSGKMKNRTRTEFRETYDAITQRIKDDGIDSFLIFSDEEKSLYTNGFLSSGQLNDLLVKRMNGIVTNEAKHTHEIDLGVEIELTHPKVPVINKEVNVNVKTPEINVPNLTFNAPVAPTITPPTITPINIAITPPDPVLPVNVSIAQPPNPQVPAEKVISVQAPNIPNDYEPLMVTEPESPVTPVAPTISVLTPASITFNGTGFGQDVQVMFNGSQGIAAMNFDGYSSTSGINITANSSTVSWIGDMAATHGGSTSNLPTSSSYSYSSFNTFISDVLDHDVTVTGNFSMTSTSTNKFPMFISLNPYEVGKNSSADKTFTFAGDLTLNGVSAGAAATGAGILGIEHQLLAGGGSGLTNVTNVNDGTTTSILRNTGNIYLNSGYNMIGIMIDTEYFYNNSNSYFKKNPKTINDGLIQINSGATQSVAIDYGYYIVQNGVGLTGPNTEVSIGNIIIDGTESYGYRQKYYGNSYYDLTSFDGSNGVIELNGTKNVGIFIGEGKSTGDPLDNATAIQIEVGGNENVGFLRSDGNPSYNATAIKLDGNKLGNTFKFKSGATDSALIRSDVNEVILAKDINLTDGSTGNTALQADKTGKITLDTGITLKSNLPSFYGITVGDFVGSSGAFGKNLGKIEITSDNSIGMAIYTGNNGENKGTLYVEGDGGVGIYNLGTFDITGGSITVKGDKASAIYNVGTINTNGNAVIAANDGATGIFSAAGSTFTNNVGNNLKINVTDANHKGVAVYATGGNTNLNTAVITVRGGAAGAAAINGGTTINLQGGTIDFEGNGYAAYSDGNGQVDLTNSGKLILRGNSAGFKVDLGSGASPVLFDSTSSITMMSNKAIAMTLTNVNHASNPVDLSALLLDVKTKVGSVPVYAGTEGGVTYDAYRLAATDGGNITIDVPITKSADGTGPSGVWEESFFFYRSFLAQKSKLYVENNLTAQIDSAIANKFFLGQVSGIEMNSSRTATGVGDSLINASNGAIILADRTDTGAGAVGVYANFATVQLDNTVKVNVETGANVVNDSGIGIFAVDGSKVNTAADILVNGNKAVGIIGLAYRIDANGDIVGQEFGGITGEGITDIVNTGKLEVKGNEAIGIYGLNNSNNPSLPPGTPVTTMSMSNNGIIEVGTNSGAKNAVGIYADGDIKINTGSASNIILGEEGIGIYLANGADLQTVGGTISLGKDSIGLISDGTGIISAGGTFTATGSYVSGEKGKIAVAYVGPVSGTVEATPQILNMNINAGGLDHGTALYVRDKGNLTSNGNITVGNEGVGIYLDNGSVTSVGNIAMGASNKAVGIYGLKGTAVNNGTITVSHNSQYAMVGKGSGTILTNNGAINLLNTTKGVGVLLQNGAVLSDQGNITFTGTTTQSFAIISNASTVNLIGTPPIPAMDNSKKNIYVYGENGTKVNLLGTVDIDGVATAGNDKSVGIYLDGTVKANEITAAGSLTVRNGAIGVYSKGNNELLNGTYNVIGDKTIGVYLEDGGQLDGPVFNIDSGSLTTNAIGIYGSKKVINIGASGITLNLGDSSNIGTGVYMLDGASLKSQGNIIVTNGSASNTNAALYYTGTTPATNEATLDLTSDKLVGVYVDGGAEVTNKNNILYNGTQNIVGAYVGGGATYTSVSTGDNVTAQDSAGFYSARGTGINAGEIKVSNGQSVAMIAKSPVVGDTTVVENTGKITVDNGVGMLMGDVTNTAPALGTSKGKNTGMIEVNNGSTGVSLSNYDDSYFDGKNGKMKITNGAGLYMLNTTAGKITGVGEINVVGNDALGIYTDGGEIDFESKIMGTSGVGIYAINGAKIGQKLDASESTGTIGVFLDTTSNSVVFNNATILAGSGNQSAGIFFKSVGTYTLQGVNVTAKGKDTIGLYLDPVNNINDKSTLTLDEEALGVYVDTGATYTTDGNTINIGDKAVGVFNKGTANIGNLGNVTINFTGNGGIGLYNDGGILNLGPMLTIGGSGSGTFAATTNGDITNNSTLNVGKYAVGLLGKYHGGGLYQLINTGTGIINVSDTGIGIAAIQDTANPIATNVVIGNQGQINVKDTDSIGIYTDVAQVVNTGTISITDNGVGMYVMGTGSIGNVGIINVAQGIGLVADNVPIAGTGNITLNNGTTDHYSIGGYYIGISSLPALTVTQSGNYSMLGVIDNSTGVALGNLTSGSGATNNQLSYYLKNSTATSGTITVSGDNNLGIYSDKSTLTSGAVTIGASSTQDKASVGIYSNNGNINSGDVTGGNNVIGIYGEKSNINTGKVAIGDNGIGVYAKGAGNISSIGDMTVGEGNSIGIYGKGTNISLGATNVTVGNGTSAAIISEGNGNVVYNGNTTVADKGASTGSMVMYKKGADGNIQTTGNWDIGKHGYGIFVVAESGATSGLIIDNNANITLKEAAVGIYADATLGKITVENSGILTVGPTYLGPNNSHVNIDEHENSVGMYIKGGAIGKNTGTIIVAHDHSVGVYAVDEGTNFENTGTINVSNGSTGIFAKTKASIINSGTINVLDAGSACGAFSIGIASYIGTIITNTTTGTINAGDGIGIYVATGGTVYNQGKITVNDGIGIYGPGKVVNTGQISVTGNGSMTDSMIETTIEEGAIKIDEDGIKVNGQYVSIGGTFVASKPIVLNGAYVDITTIIGQVIPLFTSPNTSGTVHLTPNFATLGNGYSYSIENFAGALAGATASTVTVETSPMFITKVTSDGTLYVVKKPYSDFIIGDQFKELTDGLDSLLYQEEKGASKDSMVLKNLNAYLETVFSESGERAFNEELSRSLAETRGDIYSTIQTRMQTVQKSFDSSFEELLDSYNITKDSGKFSVIYTQGDFEDDTVGIDDYDYRIQGLLYMKEFEGRNFGSKWGYTLGFAVSRFEFDDAPIYGSKSKEDVYSLRAGLHNVYNFSDEDSFRLVTRLELGYNRHEAKRKLELDKVYTNDGKYNSYQVTLDNRFEKTIYRSLTSKVDLYAGVNLEYGKIDGFSESGDGLELKLKSNDYFSIQPEVGIRAERRVHLGKKLSAKIFAEGAYAYELGDNYDRNKARVKNGTEGWYNLIRGEKEEGIIKGKIGLTVEKANKAGVTFDVEARKHDNKDKSDVRYNARFKYVF